MSPQRESSSPRGLKSLRRDLTSNLLKKRAVECSHMTDDSSDLLLLGMQECHIICQKKKKKNGHVSRMINIIIINMETSWEIPGPGKSHLSAFIWLLEALHSDLVCWVSAEHVPARSQPHLEGRPIFSPFLVSHIHSGRQTELYSYCALWSAVSSNSMKH